MKAGLYIDKDGDFMIVREDGSGMGISTLAQVIISFEDVHRYSSKNTLVPMTSLRRLAGRLKEIHDKPIEES